MSVNERESFYGQAMEGCRERATCAKLQCKRYREKPDRKRVVMRQWEEMRVTVQCEVDAREREHETTGSPRKGRCVVQTRRWCIGRRVLGLDGVICDRGSSR